MYIENREERRIPMENISNIKKFATEVSEIIGERIEDVFPSAKGRSYFIQPPKLGAPMILKHYEGTLFIDIHPIEYKGIASGSISVHEYILSANWQIGFYFCGVSMLDGGFYKPFDIVGHKDEANAYFKNIEDRKSIIQEQEDPRKYLFKALRKRFWKEYPGYTISKMFCGNFAYNEVRLRANKNYLEGEPFSFAAYVSEQVIRSLLMHEIEPKDWDSYVDEFKFFILKRFNTRMENATKESVKKAFSSSE